MRSVAVLREEGMLHTTLRVHDDRLVAAPAGESAIAAPFLSASERLLHEEVTVRLPGVATWLMRSCSGPIVSPMRW